MIKEVSSEEFKELIQEPEKLVLTDFHADRFDQCKMMLPIMKQVAEEYREKVKVFRLDIEKNPDIALEYRVLSIPTILVFQAGKLKGRIEGVTTKTAIDQKLKKYL